LNAFSEENQDKLIEYVMKENKIKCTALHHAACYEHEGIVNLLLNKFSEEKDKLIEYVMKENEKKFTALHYAASVEHEGIVKLLLDAFSEDKDKLIDYVMKGDEFGRTILHRTAETQSNYLSVEVRNIHKDRSKNVEMVQFLFELFDDKDKLIEYMMQEDESKNTALHLAVGDENKELVKLLLNQFGEDERLNKYLKKQNEDGWTAFSLASSAINKQKSQEMYQLLTSYKK
jgi:ankyrin repeat protein